MTPAAQGTPRTMSKRRTSESQIRAGNVTIRDAVDFWAHTICSDGCWHWTGRTNARTGYGYLWWDGRRQGAHRVAYELAKGAIPVGMQIDHLCRNRACVNPSHMEPVPPRVNYLRGVGITAQAAARTACPRGHAYDRVSKDGSRDCGTCHADRMRERRAARAAIAAARGVKP